MPNPFCHIELNTTDLGAAKTFYGQLFDWELQDAPNSNGSYTFIKVGDGTGGGMMTTPTPGAPSFWLAYILIDPTGAALALWQPHQLPG